MGLAAAQQGAAKLGVRHGRPGAGQRVGGGIFSLSPGLMPELAQGFIWRILLMSTPKNRATPASWSATLDPFPLGPGPRTV